MTKDTGMASPPVSFKLSGIFYDASSHRVAVNIANKLFKIIVNVTQNGFKSILKNITATVMSTIVITGVAAQQRRHEF